MAAASSMTGAVLGLGAIGYFLGQKFGSPQYGLLIGALAGVLIGMYELYKSVYMKDKDQ
ncbi:MAG: AtpZ/AtpI family protein [Candidatus Marinimicrobia bacterium]|nr:AtpZ/AtpI family protein [Candidatus Neomarinimicrobiota bacterium]MCF7922343.1 AtpZ/AtpI family protein [Candidatus Neomarinimicrobiota bacterium]